MSRKVTPKELDKFIEGFLYNEPEEEDKEEFNEQKGKNQRAVFRFQTVQKTHTMDKPINENPLLNCYFL